MSPDPTAQFLAEGAALLAALELALPLWVESSLRARAPGLGPAELDEVSGVVTADALRRLSELLAADPDEQRTTPLTVLRRATGPMTDALVAAGVEMPRRDPFDERIDPDDPYGFGPRSFAELGEPVGDAGLRWGAAKAFVHRHRHGG